MRICCAWVLLATTGCLIPVGENVLVDAGKADAGGVEDAGRFDAGRIDAGTAHDAGPFDAGPFDAGSADACYLADGGAPVASWCLEQAVNLRRCSQAAVVGCTDHPMAIAIDSSHLVWSTQGRGVFARPLDGGAVIKLGQGEISVSVAVREGFAYWVENGPSASVFRAPLTGGTPKPIATQQAYAHSLAVNGTHAHWVADQTSIHRVALTSGTVQTFVGGESAPHGLALDATHLYWGNGNNGQIRRVPLTGGTATTLYSGQPSPWLLRVVNGYVYWNADNANGDLKRGPVTGGVPEVIASNQDVAREFATDGVWLYWFAQGTNFGQPAPQIFRVPVSGGTAVKLLSPKRGGPLALDGARLYFGSEGVWSLPR